MQNHSALSIPPSVPSIRVGLRVRGGAGLVVHRPVGSGDYVVIRFIEPARFGVRRVEAGDCLFLAPDTPTTISAGASGIFNDFVHISPDLIGNGILDGLPIPVARPFALRDHTMLVEALVRLQSEWSGREAFWETALDIAARELILLLSRAARAAELGPLDTETIPHASALRAARRQVQGSLSHPWTVPEMARLTGLRSSRFSHLYKTLVSGKCRGLSVSILPSMSVYPLG